MTKDDIIRLIQRDISIHEARIASCPGYCLSDEIIITHDRYLLSAILRGLVTSE